MTWDWETQGIGYSSVLFLATELIGLGLVWGVNLALGQGLTPGILDAFIIAVFSYSAWKTLVQGEELSKKVFLGWLAGVVVFVTSFALGIGSLLV